MLQGEIRRAVRYITERELFAVHNPHGSYTSNGTTTTVLDALRNKHPLPQLLHPRDLPKFDFPPPPLPSLLFTDEQMSEVATKLGGASGLNGVDGHTLKTWLLYHRKSSSKLRDAFRRLVTWQANNNIPWAAIRALKSKRGLALNKFPGVRPIGIGNIEDRYVAKILLADAGPSAADAASTLSLSAGLSAGIEGAVHAANQAWTDATLDDNFGFLLIDARNAFNELDRNMMLYVLRHIWPRGARFAFNSYKRWSTVLFHDSISGTATTITSATGVTQGDPIAMIAYSLTLTPLSRQLLPEFPELLQLWVADDNSAAGSFGTLKLYFNRLVVLGKPYGYHVQPNKCKLVTRSSNFLRAGAFFRTRSTAVALTTHARLLGSHLGSLEETEAWLGDQVATWSQRVTLLAAVTTEYPQSAYVALQRSLQLEWSYLQRTTPCSPALYQPIEDAIANTFIPAQFQLSAAHPSLPPRSLTRLPLKWGGMAIFDPVATCTAITSKPAAKSVPSSLPPSSTALPWKCHPIVNPCPMASLPQGRPRQQNMQQAWKASKRHCLSLPVTGLTAAATPDAG